MPDGDPSPAEMALHTDRLSAAGPRRRGRRYGRAIFWLTFIAVLAGLAADAAWERHWTQTTRPQITVSGLPPAFDGLTVCQITDIHQSVYMPPAAVRSIVDRVNSLQPDLIAITGDNSSGGVAHVDRVWKELARLRAPLGVYGVMGNHEYPPGIANVRKAMAAAGIRELRNDSVPLALTWPPNSRIWLAGVVDMWQDKPDLRHALRAVPPNEPVILLAHNPDFADEVRDPRVKLIVAGHSHGGQVVLPFYGPIFVPCERKYARGLVQTATGQMYISRGLGVTSPPIRMNCRPELPLITLHSPATTTVGSDDGTSPPPSPGR